MGWSSLMLRVLVWIKLRLLMRQSLVATARKLRLSGVTWPGNNGGQPQVHTLDLKTHHAA